jgi:hypothetical protein
MPIIYKNNIEKVKKRILKNNEDVELVEVLYDHGIYTLDLELDIYFYDGRRILLERVNKKGGGNIRISRIGPYGIRGYIRFLRRTYAIKTDILENELGINLNTVDDILRNYSSIYNFIDGFEDINSEKYDIYNKKDERWIWDGKLGLKTVLFNDEEICFFKRQWPES